MRQEAIDAVAVKLSAAGSGLAWMLSWDASVHFIGVPLNVLLAGLTGALLGVAYGEPLPNRVRLLIVTIVNAFIAAGVTGILPHLPLFGWLGNAPAAAVALLVGFGCRWAVPAAIDKIPELIREWRKDRSGGAP